MHQDDADMSGRKLGEAGRGRVRCPIHMTRRARSFASMSLLALPLLAACGGQVEETATAPAPGDVRWVRQGHGEHVGLVDLVVASDGHVVVSGAFQGTVDLGGATLHEVAPLPPWTTFVAELDGDGAPLWNERFLGEQGPVSGVVALGPDGAIHWTGSDMDATVFGSGPVVKRTFFVKLDAAGRLVWNPGFEGIYGNGVAIGVASNGDVVVGGTYGGALDLGGGPLPAPPLPASGVFLAKLDAGGHHLWSRSLGVGTLSGIAVAPDGRSAVVGSLQGPRMSLRAIFLFDPSGAQVWEKDLALTEATTAFSMRRVAFGDAGSVVVTGDHSGTVDLGAGPLTGVDSGFVAKYSASGALLWTRRFGDLDPALTTDALGNTWLASGAPAGAAVVVTRLDASGTPRWARTFPNAAPSWTFVSDLASDASGAPYLVGTFSGTNALDRRVTTSGEDVFLAKLSP